MKPIHLLTAIAVACVWGLNFSVIKLGVSEIDPLILTAMRFTFAAFPAVLFIPKPNASWKLLITYGLMFGVGVWGLLTLSIHVGLSAGVSSLLLQSSAFISVLFGYFILKEKIKFTQYVGMALSLAGLLLIFTLQDGSINFIGICLALIASVCLSGVSLLIKKHKISDMFAFVVWSSLAAPIPLLLLSFLVGDSSIITVLSNDLTGLAIFSILFQAYPVTLLGYWVWNKLIYRYPMSTMAPLTLLVPLFGLLGSYFFYQEQISMIKLSACGLIIAGVAVSMLDIKTLKKCLPSSLILSR